MADMMMWYIQLSKKNSIISAEQGREALQYFKEKYKRIPTTIFINPEQAIENIEGILLKRNKSVLKSHLYIAENELAYLTGKEYITYRETKEHND